MTHILIVDDEPVILEVLTAYFEKEGWQVTTAATGHEALMRFQETVFDLIVLDLMLPDLSGESVNDTIRKDSDVPIIMLTAKTKEEELIAGIERGADDYIKKPFSPKEVVIRIKAQLRRRQKQAATVYSYQALTLNPSSYEAHLNGDALRLTPNEFELLALFIKYPGQVFSREALLEAIDDEGMIYEGYDRTIDTHIKNLRKKIEPDRKHPRYIQTVFGRGYKFGGTS